MRGKDFIHGHTVNAEFNVNAIIVTLGLVLAILIIPDLFLI